MSAQCAAPRGSDRSVERTSDLHTKSAGRTGRCMGLRRTLGLNVAAARSSRAPAADFPAAEHWSHATEAAKRGSAHGFPRAVCFPAHSLAHGDSAGTARYAQIAPVECFAENAAWSAAFASVAHSAAAAALVLRSRLRSHWLIGGRRANWHAPPRDCSTPQARELP